MKRSLALACSFGLLCGNPAAAALTRIGATGGVGGKVLALAPEAGAVGRIMASGQTVYHKDKVNTDANGRMQILLLDETVFTIGPNSEIVLDEFVYDPFTETGKVSAKITKGVFRFVSGKVARKRPSDVNIKLPSGTIGIRGTIVGGRVDGNTAIVALLGPGGQNDANERPGSIAVQNAGVTVDITRPGYATKIVGAGIPPTPPFQLTPAQLAQLSTAPAPEPAKTGPEAGAAESQDGGKSVSEESGESTASAQGDLSQTVTTGGLAQDFNQTTVVAAQSGGGGIVNGISQWDDVRSITSGTGYYFASGNYTCAGVGLCSAGGSGSWIAQVDIDFSARTMGGGASMFDFISGTLNAQASSSISSFSFSALPGNATVTLGAGNSSNSSYYGSSFSLINSNGQAANAVQANLVWTNGSDNASGSATGLYY